MRHVTQALKIENVSPRYGLDVDISLPGGNEESFKKHIPLSSTISFSPPGGEGTVMLRVESEDHSWAWNGIVPTKIRSSIRIDPDTDTVSYNGVSVPRFEDSAPMKTSTLFIVFLVLFALGLAVYLLS